ncbi:uncharacterized protein LTR77_005206 [Saxophila tyrrhenica]|uniref:Uncharacterized protein n=1 Tax=Saxophila tyrrhenica TaxID=1690608 RepID=A0AAV9PEP3_9PEZI|nr:hypothetical protein LTR77_005206 [Saxophila tyrrhenica]
MTEPVNNRDSLCSVEDLSFQHDLLPTPEIFAKSGSAHMINIRAFQRPPLDQHSQFDGKVLSSPPATLPPTSFRYNAPSIRLQHPEAAPALRSTIRTASPAAPPPTSNRTTTRPTVAIPNRDHRQKSAESGPASALLALASNFLGNIVKIGQQPRTSSPLVSRLGRQKEEIRIVDSEILIKVIDDETFRQNRVSYPSSAGTEASEKPECLTAFEGDGVWSAGTSHVPLSAGCKEGSAQEIDALSKMSWERQLMRAQESSFSQSMNCTL